MRSSHLHRLLPVFLTAATLGTGEGAFAQNAPKAVSPPAKATAVPPPAKPINPATLALFDKAIAATRAQQFADAANLYRRLLEKDATYAPAWANFSLLSARSGNYTEAIEDMQKAVRLEPKTAAYQAELSSLYLRMQLLPQTIVTARKTLILDAKNRIAGTNLAVALMQTRKFAEAIPVLQKLIRESGQQDDRGLYPNLAFALVNVRKAEKAQAVALVFAARYPHEFAPQMLLGDLAMQFRRFEQAHRYYEQALSIEPQSESAALKNALAVEQSGHPDLAITLLTARTTAHPQEAEAFYQLGRLLYTDTTLPSSSRLEQSEKAFRAATALVPTNPQYRSSLGLTVMFQGKTRAEDARKIFNETLQIAPTYPPAHFGLAYLAEERGDKTEAIAQYRALLAGSPNDYNARRRLAGLLLISGDKPAAYREFGELANRFPKDVVALSEVASLYAADKNNDAAKASYRAVLARDPKNVGAYLGLAKMLADEGVVQAAKEQYEAAIRVAPRNPNAYLALAALEQQQGLTPQAAAVLEKLVAVDPQNTIGRWQLAGMYIGLNRDDQAIAQMRAIQPSPTDPNRLIYLMGIANLYSQRGDLPRAVAEMKTLAKSLPNETAIQYALADAQVRAGQIADAEATLKANIQTAGAIDLRPTLALASFYQNQKRQSDAVPLYDAVATKSRARTVANPKEDDAFYLLGVALEGLKRQDDAVAAYREAIRLNPAGGANAALRRLGVPLVATTPAPPSAKPVVVPAPSSAKPTDPPAKGS